METTQEDISAHLTRENNDLSTWVEAARIKKTTTTKSFQDFVTDWIWGSERENNQK